METFALVPEFEFGEDLNFKTPRTDFSAGTSQRYAEWPDPIRKWRLVWQNALYSELAYARSFFRYHRGPAESFQYKPANPVEPPWLPGTPSAVAQTTGSYTSRTYYYAVTFVTAYGETNIMNIKSFAIDAANLFNLILPKFPPNVLSARIYLGLAENSLQLQAELSSSNARWLEPDFAAESNGIVAGAAPPTDNTALELVTCYLLEDEMPSDKVTAVSYRMALTFAEIP